MQMEGNLMHSFTETWETEHKFVINGDKPKPLTVNKSWTVERDDWFGNRVCPLHHTRCTL
ncbi:hypothetical protein F7725_009657 [Dissostichus mawsoni]|uniref:Uncharacterized protein n=1 Tax=Dissostichus mawsoni TaxID=36200 RepID=A0A7J5XMV5_DISMA|nr:hypothetical protein F7725_009657 [Dissostichus mawsoni]